MARRRQNQHGPARRAGALAVLTLLALVLMAGAMRQHQPDPAMDSPWPFQLLVRVVLGQ